MPEAADCLSVVKAWLLLLDAHEPPRADVEALARRAEALPATGTGAIELRLLVRRWASQE